jgi:hypothetical protein
MLERTRRFVPWLLIAVPVAMQAFVVRRFGVNSLVWDEFDYVPLVKNVIDGANWTDWLRLQHNEHRMIPVKILLAALAPATKWNTKAFMYASVVLAALVIAGFWKIYRDAGGRSTWRFVPVAWLFCSLAGFENMLYGLQAGFYFTALGVVGALALIGSSTTVGIAAAFGALASASTFNGLLVWPIGLGVLLVRRERLALKASWLGTSLVISALYFVDFYWPDVDPTLPRNFTTVLNVAGSAVTSVGASVGADSYAWSEMAGFVLLAGSAAIVTQLYRKDRTALAKAAPLIGSLCFGVASAAIIAVGRYGVASPLRSRYVIFTAFTAAGLYLALSLRREAGLISEKLMARAAALLVASLIVTNVRGLQAAREWRRERLREQYILQTIDHQTDAALGGLYLSDQIRDYARQLRQAGLGPYSEPQRLLLLTEWQHGEAGGEISPGTTIEQRFTCPVESLWDASLPVAILRAGSQAGLRLSLWRGDQMLGFRSVQLGALHDADWISLPLDAPLKECRDQQLVLRVDPGSSTSRSAASVWMYPAYFEGELRQAGQPIPNRSVGLALNGFHFDVLP